MKRFWFADAQLLSGPGDEIHLREILEGLIRADLDLAWSGYLRVHRIDRPLAALMVKSGLCELEVSLNSGSQEILQQLRMGFTVEEVLQGLEILRSSGYSGRILINLSLNAPGETRKTLLETVESVKRIRRIFGRDRVVPVIFFLAIQPHTGLERKALEGGHLAPGYDPLSPWPWDTLKLIYNPPPLGRLIGRCCAQAFRTGESGAGDRILTSLEEELKRLRV
ncbi:MAG: Radical SAM superfamily protein [Syntrophaceae bacterium PtaU1.Bin231]|nr:MAG: Radical SAM superfamily protein [Syntrophaceae bacterium PtaU1.Bin231]